MTALPEIQEHQEPISISSDVLARLGEELITNHIQALAELIKNAYDADATVVRISVDTERPVALPDGSVGTGVLTISDNGFGMDEGAVRNGWLRVSASTKRKMKERGEKTAKQRTPLGDKGLGRLGAQRLGDRVRIRTRPQPDASDPESAPVVEHDVAFAFSSLSSELDVSEIQVPWRTIRLPDQADMVEPWPLSKPTGTLVEISDLASPDDWTDTTELERALSLLVNPFKGVGRFSVSMEVDGAPLQLESVAEEVRRAALTRWEGIFDGDLLTIEGSVRLNWFSVRDSKEQTQLAELISADKGVGLRKFVLDQARDSKFQVKAGKSPWLITLKRELRLSEVDDVSELALEEAPEQDVLTNGSEPGTARWRPVSPGEFLFELDTVSRRIGVARAGGLSTLDRQSEYTKWLNARGGIHVYRDGFRINLGRDVMRLGEGFSSRGSYYGVRPQNVIGYIEISAEHNRGLAETTDREGFRETPEVTNFDWLLRRVRNEINDALEVLGRSTSGFIRSQAAPAGESTEQLADELSAVGAEAKETKAAVAAASQRVRQALDAAKVDPRAQTEALQEAATALLAAEQSLTRAEAAAKVGTVVERDMAELSARVEEYAQLIGLGLVAETMAHELNHVSARLSGQIQDLEARVTDLPPWARAYLQETRSALDALHGHLRHLDPMLRYARARRSLINLGEFVEQMAAYHRPRLSGVPIELALAVKEPGTVTANRGRLMQVFDNLIINSEYWLKQAQATGRVKRPQISVDVRDAVMTVRDNGPGVNPALEQTIFEPFVTDKGKDGRGLGLFICRQLLDLDGGQIELGDHRNRTGRADSFEVSFNEAAADGP
jgi:signal transduction histidine kinase